MERWKRLPDSELEVMLIIWDGKEKVSTSDKMCIRDRRIASAAEIMESRSREEKKRWLASASSRQI